MNRDEIKRILLLYRPGSADAEDPQIAEALALAKSDVELTRWLDDHCARQSALRAKFRQIEPPAGLREQIISEHAASKRAIPMRRKVQFAMAVAAVALVATLAIVWPARYKSENTLAIFQDRMVRVALSPYSMDLATNTPGPIRAYLAQNHAPSDFILPEPLQHLTLTGCAVEGWQNGHAAMICFRTGRQLPQETSSDLWLFVVDRAAVVDAPDNTVAKIAKVNRLVTATWTHNGKLYLLGVSGNEETIRQYL